MGARFVRDIKRGIKIRTGMYVRTCVCIFFNLSASSTSVLLAYSSLYSIHREIRTSSVVTNCDLEIFIVNRKAVLASRLDNAMLCHRPGYDKHDVQTPVTFIESRE